MVRAHGLTPRERQLVALMLDGLSTRQLAAALCISPYTVQDQRTISRERIVGRAGRADPATPAAVRGWLADFLEL
jgi:DNA-binding CsgD family transcriptional regulator